MQAGATEVHTALRSTTETLAELLRSCLSADLELSSFFSTAAGGTMLVLPNTPDEMYTNGTQGLSLWLYQLIRDDQTLNLPRRRASADQLEYQRLPLRLHYLATPIIDSQGDGSAPRLEQTILGKVMQCFHDTPLVSGALLKDDFAGSDTRIAVRMEPLGLEEITRVWDALDRSYQLCVSYEVSVVTLQSQRQHEDLNPVDVVQPGLGVMGGSA